MKTKNRTREKDEQKKNSLKKEQKRKKKEREKTTSNKTSLNSYKQQIVLLSSGVLTMRAFKLFTKRFISLSLSLFVSFSNIYLTSFVSLLPSSPSQFMCWLGIPFWKLLRFAFENGENCILYLKIRLFVLSTPIGWIKKTETSICNVFIFEYLSKLTVWHCCH